ncbi:MAG: hypothetical protein EXS37_16205 [Opitutus sp.]|nr:hypothetical protein [Opitutus sp.]
MLLDRNFAPRLTGRMTNDIDVILPSGRELAIDADAQFWDAISATNRELEAKGLYITHIFPEREVVLTPEWKQFIVPLPYPGLKKLRLSRPRMLDLVVSKMGRGDLQDQADVRSMLTLQREFSLTAPSAVEIAAASKRATVPEVYREIFTRAAAQIIESVRQLEESEKPTPPGQRNRQSRGYGLSP